MFGPFSSVTELMLIGSIIFLSQTVYAALGFGSGMMFISLAGLCCGKLHIFLPLFVLLCVPTEIVILIKERKHINFQNTGCIFFASIPAMILGTLLLKKGPENFVLLFLGLLICSLSVYFLFFEEKIFNLTHWLWKLFFGFASGFLGSLYGLSGTPLIIFFKSMKYHKSAFRVNLLGIFFLMGIIRITTYVYTDLLNNDILIGALLVIPFAFLGLFVGYLVHKYLPEEKFKRVTSFVLLVSGIMIIIKQIIQFF